MITVMATNDIHTSPWKNPTTALHRVVRRDRPEVEEEQ